MFLLGDHHKGDSSPACSRLLLHVQSSCNCICVHGRKAINIYPVVAHWAASLGTRPSKNQRIFEGLVPRLLGSLNDSRHLLRRLFFFFRFMWLTKTTWKDSILCACVYARPSFASQTAAPIERVCVPHTESDRRRGVWLARLLKTLHPFLTCVYLLPLDVLYNHDNVIFVPAMLSPCAEPRW